MRIAIAAIAILVAGPLAAQDMQERRRAFIGKLQQQGIFHKLARPASLCHLYVGPRFASLALEDKEQFVNVVYAYCVTERPNDKIVVLKDYRTGKDIGTYADGWGLRLK